jgi:hypothetical protein
MSVLNLGLTAMLINPDLTTFMQEEALMGRPLFRYRNKEMKFPTLRTVILSAFFIIILVLGWIFTCFIRSGEKYVKPNTKSGENHHTWMICFYACSCSCLPGGHSHPFIPRSIIR